MLLVVTGVGSLIHIYSLGYMAHDEEKVRYFSYLNLFTFFMLLLVTCVFAALIMPGPRAVLLTACLGAFHALAAWLVPNGILRDGIAGMEIAIVSGRPMPLEEVTALAMHSAFLSHTCARC